MRRYSSVSSRRTTIEEQYDLILECRKSGLSDRDWCFSKGIPQSTFYLWLRKLRAAACYEIPESESVVSPKTEGLKQDVVKLNFISEPKLFEKPQAHQSFYERSPIEIDIDGIKLKIENTADPALVAHTLRMLRSITSC